MPPPPQDSTYSAARHSADYKDTDPLFPRNSVGRKTSHSQKRIVIVGVISALLLVTMVTAAVLSQAPPALPNSPLIVAKHGAVAAEVSSCSEAGVEILKEGGNAVDAAIAGALCLGVVNMFSTGIGGGGFMLIRLPDGHSELIDFRETAPAASNKTMFIGRPKKAQVGGLAVGVPGEIRGFGLAHSKYGKLPWRRLFEPAINMSRNGVLVGPELARRLPLFQVFIGNHADWRALFMPNGTLLKEGELLKRENLANTLEKIANEGPDVFYEGKIAEHIVSKVQATGGILTLADMRAYRAVVREPIVGYYHGRKIITGGAPTSGHALLGALNILERYNLKAEGQTPVNIHRWAEAMKYGFAFRTEIGDPYFISNTERMNEVITKEFADIVRHNLTDDKTHPSEYYNPRFDVIETHGTTHLSSVDENDLSVSLTSTVNLPFGSKVLDPVTGVILNDEMDDFSIPGVPNAFGLYPSKFNYVAPGKRPLSSSVPTIIECDSKFEMALGAAGGSRIVTATLAVILNVLDFNMNIRDAIEASRIHHQLIPNAIYVESGWPEEILKSLRQRGHELIMYDKGIPVSEVQAVMRLPDGTLHAASDYRKFGAAAGY